MSLTLLQRIANLEASVYGPLPAESGDPVPAGGVFEVASVDGAISVSAGLVVITKSASAAALTKAAPISGAADDGGDDGKAIRIYSRTAKAHVITFPSGVLQGGFTTITFNGDIGDNVEIQSYQGTFQINGGVGFTLG